MPRFDHTAPGSTRAPPHAAALLVSFSAMASSGLSRRRANARQPPHTTTTTPCPPHFVTAFASSGAYQVHGWWHALYAEDRVRMLMISADPGLIRSCLMPAMSRLRAPYMRLPGR
ncbi:hypothetical protein C8J57DRAFT_1528239 [Mycena rebaudengoi]|nr:hypothetical protein C8J57DRAFT_1528239 [Mycena rebaudengoi]